MHRAEIPLFIIRHEATAIETSHQTLLRKQAVDLAFPWRLLNTPGWEQFSRKGQRFLISEPRQL